MGSETSPSVRYVGFVVGSIIIVGVCFLIYQLFANNPAIGQTLFTIAVVAFFASLYLLPSIVASSNKHVNLAAIFVLNLLLGWTILGWIIALVWASMESQRKT